MRSNHGATVETHGRRSDEDMLLALHAAARAGRQLLEACETQGSVQILSAMTSARMAYDRLEQARP